MYTAGMDLTGWLIVFASWLCIAAYCYVWGYVKATQAWQAKEDALGDTGDAGPGR